MGGGSVERRGGCEEAEAGGGECGCGKECVFGGARWVVGGVVSQVRNRGM